MIMSASHSNVERAPSSSVRHNCVAALMVTACNALLRRQALIRA